MKKYLGSVTIITVSGDVHIKRVYRDVVEVKKECLTPSKIVAQTAKDLIHFFEVETHIPIQTVSVEYAENIEW